VPLAAACNNPCCSALGGLSEAALVKGWHRERLAVQGWLLQ
jgi:hypothetical protein